MKKGLLKYIIFIILMLLINIEIVFAETGKVKDTEYLNLREEASTSSNILTKMPSDATFEILSENGDWYQIKYQDYTGYVSKQYVEVEGNSNVNTKIEPQANAKAVVNKTSDIYVLPLLNSTKIGNISQSSEVLVISLNGKWAYIQNDNISGWIYKSNIAGLQEVNTEEENNNENQMQDNNQNIENNENNNTVDEQTNENDNQEDNSNYPKTMYVNVEAVYIRERPTTESSAVASVGLNTPVTVNGEEGEWYKVHVTDGSGYMMKKYFLHIYQNKKIKKLVGHKERKK